MTKNETYNAELAKMKKQLEELSDLYEQSLATKDINWGDVGEIQHYNSHLSQITDSFMGRGEFA